MTCRIDWDNVHTLPGLEVRLRIKKITVQDAMDLGYTEERTVIDHRGSAIHHSCNDMITYHSECGKGSDPRRLAGEKEIR